MIDYIGHTDSAVIGFVSNNTKGTRYTVERANENGIKTFEFEYTPLYENRNLQEDK